MNGLDYGWWLNFDNEKYVITYKKLSDDTNTVVFDAVQQFFWDFAKVALHAQYTGSHEYTFYLGQLFDKSGYTYKNDATVPAFEKENWGYKNKLDLFNDIIDQAGVEFEVHNETVHIAKQLGSDLTSFVRKGINLSDLTEEMKISDFATYARGYGAFKDDQDQSKGRLEVEYRSELAKKFGDLEMDPIVDERYTIADNLIAALKKQVDATYTVSMTMNIYDLENAGYPNYEAPKVGDWILAIDEALNFKRKIRIIQLEEQFDVTGKRIGYTATCGDFSIVDQYTHLQSSLDSKVQRIQESVDAAATSANGKNTNYYGAKEPVSANEGDLWFDQSNDDQDKWSIKQWLNGRWEQITLNPGEVDAKVDVAKKEAETAVENAKSASDKADQLASKYDDTNALTHQALDRAVSAQSDANSAVATANSTASEFGKVSQKTDSALTSAVNAQSAASDAISAANSTASDFGKVSQKTDSAVATALNAQSNANDAVKQASSAAADSKDAKQIAGAVSQSYKTLTDGSTMTIAELESGLAVKLTKNDLDGYATQTWTQNQIKVTADGINGTMSSIKSTVNGNTTSINDLKADSSSFKSQFTTVNNTLGKQTTDIGSLQATSKELTTGFNTLTSDNTTNKNDISQLKQTATEVSSTLETVQTQVKNSAVGTNLYTDTKNFDNLASWWGYNAWTKTTDTYKGLAVVQTASSWNGLSQYIQVKKGDVLTYSVYAKYISGTGKSTIYWSLNNSPEGSYSNATTRNNNTVTITDSWQRISGTSVATSDGYLRPRLERTDGNTNTLQIAGIKLEKGSLATDWCPNPADNATVTAMSKLSQTVDGMKADISKKIEQTDLNGYATEDWTNNQISITANGINGTISSVKSTVDGHTTSINTLQADSNSFKSQFTTVNDTLGKHTTDIGTLQASANSLSASFDSLNTDNDTNKHNISQLQASATTFNSTLMTVQQQVTDSAVGTNYLRDSDKSTSGWSQDLGTIPNEVLNSLAGETITISADIEWSNFQSDDTHSKQNRLGFELSVSGSDGKSYWLGAWKSPATPSGRERVSTTFTLPKNVTFTVKNNGANGYVSINGTGIVSHAKLEKGSLSTDWCRNPAETATVTAISSISQTVEGIKSDISKKIEQKDLNGYATQTWAQNKINATADGIKATVSSVKSTVNGHTTSINDLKADSSSFKSQFTTVNNTLGKQNTDISTLQATSKSLSANFDSLSSDNKTNKHNIGQLQASAKEFNSTLMTVQQRVTDSSVGTNLLLKTGTPFSMTGRNIVNQAMQIYALSRRLEAGTTVTLSFDVVSTAFANFIIQNNASGDGGTWMEYLHNTADTTKKHYVATITLNGYSQQGMYFRVDNMPSTTTITVSNMKLELGSYATDYSANPADNATVTAVSSISQTVDSIQTTVRGKVDNHTYQSKMTQLDKQITSVVGQVNNLGQRNLIYNSEITSNTDGWSSNIPLYVGFNQWDHFNGSNSLVFSPHGFSVGTWSHAYSKMVPVFQGMRYSASATLFITGVTPPTATAISMEIDFFDDSDNRVGAQGASFDISKWGTHQFLKTEGWATPKNATKVCLALQMNGEGNLVCNHPMLVSDSTVGAYLPDSVGQSEYSQLATNINFKVSKDGVINAINISNEGTQIYGNKLRITAATYIDNAVIKDAMIADLSASKLTAGSINAATINVYNINGSNIVANSISADKLQAGSMLIAMNSTLQTLKLGTDGLYTTNNSGTFIGKIHANNLIEHPGDWGLHFDLSSNAQYMAWGAQNENDPNGGYVVKFGWTRNSSAGDFTMPWGGFWFNDNVMLHKNLRFNGGGIDVDGAYQLMKFAWISMNGIKYPFFGSSNLKAGWLFGSHETYLVRDGGIINASKILGILNGQHYKFIKDLNSNGTVKGYVDVNF
nr:phage tail protein [Lactiplantibacillus plantarum]